MMEGCRICPEGEVYWAGVEGWVDCQLLCVWEEAGRVVCAEGL